MKTDRAIERALAKLTAFAGGVPEEGRKMQNTAHVLPLDVRIQLNNMVEENDLLRFRLHEATLVRAIAATETEKKERA